MDEAHIQTDKMIDDLKKELDAHYSKAADEVRKKTDDFFQKYQAQDIEKQADLQSGKLSKEEYQSWQKGKIFTGKRWEDMQDTLAKDLAATDQIAADIINNKKCDAYALNHNYGTYEIEHQTGISTSFTLYDHDTVERLIAEKPEILPKNKVNIPKDQAWNKQLLRNAVTQGVLQGESIPKIAKRMQNVTYMDKNSAIRNSRTAMTGAQNAGRVDSYKRAQDLGIDVTQQWMSTLDARTRNSHRLLMGEKRKVGEKFSNGLRFPGDPEGPGYEVYNCRCTLVAKVDGYGPDVLKDAEEKITKNGETFEQWQKGHSFPKHYDETVKQWMARYAEHLKKQSFKDWMKEQTKPQVEAKTIHPNAQVSLDNIKFEKSKLMSFDDADMYHVNPGYNKDYMNKTQNCQTCVFVYEARRQGYDVVALPRDQNLMSKVYNAQMHLAKDQSLGWINKKTGEHPKNLLNNTVNKNLSPKETFDKVNAVIGKNGERYCIEVEFKSGGWHIMNIERDIDGNLCLVDNQRGKLEKHIWKNNEIKTYFESIENVGRVFRLDDCVPNFEYLNVVARKTIDIPKKVSNKADLPKNFDEFYEGKHAFGEQNIPVQDYLTDKLSAEKGNLYNYDDYYNYYDKYIKDEIQDPELDKILGIASKTQKPTSTKSYAETKSQVQAQEPTFDKSQLQKKSMSAVFTDIKSTDIDTANKFYEALKAEGEPKEAWKKYLDGEFNSKTIDDILAKKYSTIAEALPGESVTGLDIDTLSKKKVMNVCDELSKSGDKAGSNQLYKDLKSIGQADSLKPSEVWKKYLNGELDFDQIKQIDKHLLKLYSKTTTPLDVSGKTKNDLHSNVLNLSDDEFSKVSDKLTEWNINHPGDKEDIITYYKKYKNNEIQDADLDKLFNIKSQVTVKPESQIQPKTLEPQVKQQVQSSVDLSKLQGKKLMNICNEFTKDGDKKTGDQLYKDLKTIGQIKGLKPSETWNKYLNNELSLKETSTIDKYLINKYGKAQPEPLAKPQTKASAFTFDKTEFSGKKMSQVCNDLGSKIDNKEKNLFYADLKSIGKPSQVWNDYLDGKLSQDQNSIIESHLKKLTGQNTILQQTFDKSKLPNGILSVPLDIFLDVHDIVNKKKTGMGLSSNAYYKKYKSGEITDADLDKIFEKKYETTQAQTSTFDKSKLTGQNTIQPQTKPQVDQKALDAAKQELDKAKQDLEDAKKKLPKNKTYSGIWKDDVTLENYEAKKDKIAAKKQYFQDEINSYEPHMDELEPWQMQKLASFYEHLQELDEFEKLGQEYSKAKNDLAPLEKKVKDAQDKVTKLSPVDEAYTQERKDNAKWFTKSQYSKGDKYYDALARPVHAQATFAEHSAYVEYTSASGGFNRPLAGFEAPKYSGADGWDEKYYKGVGNVPLDNEGKGKKIKDLTTFVAKSKTQDDIWVQTAQNFATLEGENGFLGVPYGSLQSMSDAELQQFVGVQNTLGQFISGSINRGGGSYTPGGMRINIYLPRGSEALYVLGDGTFGKIEHEIILQRGGTYKVSKIYWGEDAEDGGKKLIVDLELRLELGYNKYGQ